MTYRTNLPQMLNLSIQRIPGISTTDAYKLRNLRIQTIADLLHYYPRQHLTFKRTCINSVKADETVTIVGKLVSHQISSSRSKPNLTLQKWQIRDKNGSLGCTQFYNHPYYQSHEWRTKQQTLYQPGAIAIVTGKVKVDSYTQNLVINNPTKIQVVELEVAKAACSSIVPVYPLSKGITNEVVRHCTQAAIGYAPYLEDPLPEELREQFELLELRKAIANIHYPTDQATLDSARRRLIFDEFFYLALAMLQRRQAIRHRPSLPIVPTGQLIDQLMSILPFSLTKAQERVASEILFDLSQSNPMNRLVQGDVGSGKTVIAVIAALSAIESGYQVALMAPTEVLAQQHYRSFADWLEQLNVSIALLTGSTSAKQRAQIHQNLESGQLSIVVGTHALFQEKVQFQQLGLAIIDEQHRFGVNARERLQQKGKSPHVLTMTATPIPRTLALTIHGDLDVSQIDELPPGRQSIKTKAITNRMRHKAYDLIRQEVDRGRQAYIILPLIEESEKLDLKAAIEEHQRIQEQVFPEFQIGLLHGQKKSVEKKTAIAHFQTGITPILVSTTVVEVGVDCPNATVILIEHAERFGLSQLHQLRGRVGRSIYQSYCFLVSNSKSDNVKQRLRVMEQSQDGFYLAEMDLRLRGPGQILGTQQSGLPELAIADLTKDEDLLEIAYQAAQWVLKKDPTLTCWSALQQELSRRHKFFDLESTVVLN